MQPGDEYADSQLAASDDEIGQPTGIPHQRTSEEPAEPSRLSPLSAGAPMQPGAPASAPPVTPASAPPVTPASAPPVTPASAPPGYPVYGQPHPGMPSYLAGPGYPGPGYQAGQGYQAGPGYPGPAYQGAPAAYQPPPTAVPPGYAPPMIPGQPGYPQSPHTPQHARPYPQPGYAWQPQLLPPPPPKRSRWKVVLVVALVAAFVLCVLPAVGATGYYLLSGRSANPSAQPTPTSVANSRPPARKPVAGDSESVFRDWMNDRVTEALSARDKALLAGDQAGYLTAGDSSKPQAVARLRKQYASLRQLQVGGWRSEILGLQRKSGAGFDAVWEVQVASHPCFGVATCEDSISTRAELWKLVGEKPMVQQVDVSSSDTNGPRPWEVADLRAIAGKRTVVATTPKYASALASLSKQAESAAVVADRFAYRESADKYLIFYAGPAEWKLWFSWGPPDWAGGASVELGETHSELVLNAAVLRMSFLDNILRHELTHASSIPGRSGHRADWWMVEGLAEYALMDGSPARLYTDLPLVKQLVHNGWDGDVDVAAPRDADKDGEVAAKYGIAFLAIRALAERYGEDKMLQFFMDVVHEHKTKDAAAQAAFGKPWAQIAAECAAYVKSTAG